MFYKWILPIIGLMLIGCLHHAPNFLDFGPDITTRTPSVAEVQRCRAEMYINPDLEIVPEGCKLTSGIDAAIWFRFVAKTNNLAKVFRKDKVDTTKFTTSNDLTGSGLPSWWDVNSKKLAGGQVALPNVRFMNVGYVNNKNGTLTVYVMWHET